MNLEELKTLIKDKLSNINFIPYFYKPKERPYLTEDFVKDSLKNFDNYLGFQRQIIRGNERYRLGIKLSERYVLVVVLEVEKQSLNIVTAWKSSRKWQKAIQK